MLSKTNIYTDNWVDMVFADRNKEYGAFVLRKKSNHYTTLAVILAVALFGLAISIPVIVNYIKGLVPQNEVVVPKDVGPVFEAPPSAPPPDQILEPPPPLEPIKTVQYVVPVVVEDVAEEQENTVIPEEVQDVTIGTQTVEGREVEGILLEEPSVGGDGDDDNAIVPYAEQSPGFPGGDLALTKFLQANLRYPVMASENNIEGRVMVQFVVEKDGSITAVEVLGAAKGYGLEEEAQRVVKSMPKWNAGKQNGRPVRVKFKLPIVFRLERN